MNKNRLIILTVGCLLLLASVSINIYQFASVHRIGYESHVIINGVPAPDKIVWHGLTYSTVGEANPNMVTLKWVGTATAGSQDINVFQRDGISSNKELDYVLGDRLVTAENNS
ncbi:hypothetical protein [Alicyclobacillus dauci]|uniref:Uncharacterized protein n=1 Tax=Alicyclobacillus dauci TaxID=1475485 RepID=A0ABY6Z414_9BACL|nr:hypothetical protein [Alicyclobacillus dauci]WAH37494.1 hypothetical protein NZD86_02865 [Alicyclobacillus dauci]